MGPNNKKRVVVVGGGAAGMVILPVVSSFGAIIRLTYDIQSCAATLANHPDKFEVTVLERDEVVGGQATSIPIDEKKYGAAWMNNGVQGGTQVSESVFKVMSTQLTPLLDFQAYHQLLRTI